MEWFVFASRLICQVCLPRRVCDTAGKRLYLRCKDMRIHSHFFSCNLSPQDALRQMPFGVGYTINRCGFMPISSLFCITYPVVALVLAEAFAEAGQPRRGRHESASHGRFTSNLGAKKEV
jgi:hypothetical protein